MKSIAEFAAPAQVWNLAHRVELLRCEGSDAIGAKRTCRERRERVDVTKMTPISRHRPTRNFAAMAHPSKGRLAHRDGRLIGVTASLLGTNVMRRRDFITLLERCGGVAARGGRADRRCVGSRTCDTAAVWPDGYIARVHAFSGKELKDAGYEGENVSVEYRWAENQLDRLPD